MNVFYDFTVPGLDGSTEYSGAAARQGDLGGERRQQVRLHARNMPVSRNSTKNSRTKNFTVVGFPCNQFGAQEPGTAAEIQSFCSVNFGVTFPLSAKIEVNGPHRHPLYAWLTAPENGFPGDIGWNFEKFLIDRGGRVDCRYPAGTKPTDPTLLQDLANVLE